MRSNPLARLFNLQAGDGRRGTLLFFYLLLIITCYQLGKTARDALFLSVFKASKLPYADMAIALSVGVVIAAYVTIGRRVALRNLLVGCLLLFAALQCGFWYLAKFRPELTWQYPVFYIWVGILGVIAPTQVWTLANYLLTTREAKRIFGLVGAGGISGWIFSGLLAEKLAQSRGSRHREPPPRDGDRPARLRRDRGDPLAREGAARIGGPAAPRAETPRRACGRAWPSSSPPRT